MNFSSRVKTLFRPRRKPRRLAAPPTAAKRIHANVKDIVKRLGANGFSALVVGGAVRDLMLGRSPRDFDLATDARPEQVRRLFPNARIIGRRFRLVHLTYPDMTVEVATFRASAPRTQGGMIMRDNTYGTPEEDAFRRDFTVNALTYDISAGEVIDHVGGLADLESRTIRTITPPHVSLREDPVRMLRVVRFMVGLDFAVEPELERVLRRMTGSLRQVKRHRLAEETQRFLTRGHARSIFQNLDGFGLLVPMLGMNSYEWFFRPEALSDPLPLLKPYLAALDEGVGPGKEAPSATVALLGLLLALVRPELRAVLLGTERKAGRDKGRDKGDGAGAAGKAKPPPPRKLRGDLHSMLGSWGLLKGQVAPALQILEAMRLLIKSGLAGGAKAPPSGTREAWLLLALLRKPLGLRGDLATLASRQMDGLPVLPIFDHLPRRSGPRHGGRGRAGTGHGSGKDAKEPTAHPPSRRRRSRRRGGRNRASL
jgi:hypothetical protein